MKITKNYEIHAKQGKSRESYGSKPNQKKQPIWSIGPNQENYKNTRQSRQTSETNRIRNIDAKSQKKSMNIHTT